jgi:threonyl-tRNA synthetase
VDVRSEKIGFKIREAEVQKIPYILVVGDKEMTAGTVSVRQRGGQDRGVMPGGLSPVRVRWNAPQIA